MLATMERRSYKHLWINLKYRRIYNMLAEKIEALREILNSMIASNDYAYSEILEVSQELDVLIVQYYREA